jgi:hypothetical protein
MNLTANTKVLLTASGDVNLSTSNNIHFTFSLGSGFHIAVWKTLMPLLLLITLCACVLHWAGVI